MPSASPTSPNWRSRSTTTVEWPAVARASARLHAVSVFPVPPFGPRTATIDPVFGPLAPPRRAIAFSSANERSACDCGRAIRSAAPDWNARCMIPFGLPTKSTTTGGRPGISREAVSISASACSASCSQATSTSSAVTSLSGRAGWSASGSRAAWMCVPRGSASSIGRASMPSSRTSRTFGASPVIGGLRSCAGPSPAARRGGVSRGSRSAAWRSARRRSAAGPARLFHSPTRTRSRPPRCRSRAG